MSRRQNEILSPVKTDRRKRTGSARGPGAAQRLTQALKQAEPIPTQPSLNTLLVHLQTHPTNYPVPLGAGPRTRSATRRLAADGQDSQEATIHTSSESSQNAARPAGGFKASTTGSVASQKSNPIRNSKGTDPQTVQTSSNNTARSTIHTESREKASTPRPIEDFESDPQTSQGKERHIPPHIMRFFEERIDSGGIKKRWCIANGGKW